MGQQIAYFSKKKRRKTKNSIRDNGMIFCYRNLKITANLNFTLPKKIPFDNEAAITLFKPYCLKKFMTSVMHLRKFGILIKQNVNNSTWNVRDALKK